MLIYDFFTLRSRTFIFLPPFLVFLTFSLSNSFFVLRYNRTLIYLFPSLPPPARPSISFLFLLLQSRFLSLFHSRMHTHIRTKQPDKLLTTHKIPFSLSLFRSTTLASTEFSCLVDVSERYRATRRLRNLNEQRLY